MKLMQLSLRGLELIKSFETLRLTAYKPVATEQYYTIGYGHYGKDVSRGMTITKEKAESLLMGDIIPIDRALNALGINFRQEQFDALVSWIFNLGIGAFNKSTMKKYIIQGRSDIEITDQLVKWINAGGKPMLGLKRRRIAEANLWLGNTYYLNSSNNIERK